MINISSSFDTVSRLSNLIENLRYLEQQKSGSRIDIDQIRFITPLSITPIAAIINEKHFDHSYQGDTSYLKTRVDSMLASESGVRIGIGISFVASFNKVFCFT